MIPQMGKGNISRLTLLIITQLDRIHKGVKVQKRGEGHKTYKNGISLRRYFFINNNFEFYPTLRHAQLY